MNLVDSYKDLGIVFDTGLKFHQHASEAAVNANRVLACMRRGFVKYNLSESVLLYKLMVQSTLEYAYIWKCIHHWGPHYALDQRKLEGVQQNLYCL